MYNRAVELCVHKYVPKSNIDKKPMGLNSPVERKIRCKEEAWNRYRAKKTPHRPFSYLRARNDATASVRKVKYEYEKKVAIDTKRNSKHFWSYTRSKTKVKEKITRVKNINGELTRNDSETAEEMNSSFNSVYVLETQT